MAGGYLVQFLERCAIVAMIAFLVIMGASGIATTLTSGYLDMLVRQNMINTPLIMIALLATGAFCGSILLFVWYRH
ncbi:MAG: hypothetical protein WC362_01770 [Methanoregula sp.]|jgi:hypothetical protein